MSSTIQVLRMNGHFHCLIGRCCYSKYFIENITRKLNNILIDYCDKTHEYTWIMPEVNYLSYKQTYLFISCIE